MRIKAKFIKRVFLFIIIYLFFFIILTIPVSLAIEPDPYFRIPNIYMFKVALFNIGPSPVPMPTYPPYSTTPRPRPTTPPIPTPVSTLIQVIYHDPPQNIVNIAIGTYDTSTGIYNLRVTLNPIPNDSLQQTEEYTVWLKDESGGFLRMCVLDGDTANGYANIDCTPTPNPGDITNYPELVVTKEQKGTIPSQPTNPDSPVIIATILPQETPTPIPTQGGQNPTGQPQPTSSPGQNPTIQAIINAITAENITTHLDNLTDKDDATAGNDNQQTRYSTSQGYSDESLYTKTFFESLGLTTSFQPVPNYGRNVIATLPGQGIKKDEYYLVMAHLDSTSGRDDNPTIRTNNNPAPGADDNASGSVAVMEIARALVNSGSTLNYSVEFILFSGEEQGMKGSTHYKQNLAGKRIAGVVNMDMVGQHIKVNYDCIEAGHDSYNGSNTIAQMVNTISAQYKLDLEVQVHGSVIEASDHASFRGMPRIMLWECEDDLRNDNQDYHKSSDIVSHLQVSQIVKSARAAAGAIASFAL